MPLRILLVAFLLTAIFSALFLACGKEQPVAVPKQQPSEPEGPPPPPPPPPDTGGQSLSSQPPTPTAPDRSLAQIARDVLAGNYGPELQSMLADEVSTCLNQMSEEGIIIIVATESEKSVSILLGANGLIMFDMGYIGQKILCGEFGGDVRLAMLRLVAANGQ